MQNGNSGQQTAHLKIFEERDLLRYLPVRLAIHEEGLEPMLRWFTHTDDVVVYVDNPAGSRRGRKLCFIRLLYAIDNADSR